MMVERWDMKLECMKVENLVESLEIEMVEMMAAKLDILKAEKLARMKEMLMVEGMVEKSVHQKEDL